MPGSAYPLIALFQQWLRNARPQTQIPIRDHGASRLAHRGLPGLHVSPTKSGKKKGGAAGGLFFRLGIPIKRPYLRESRLKGP